MVFLDFLARAAGEAEDEEDRGLLLLLRDRLCDAGFVTARLLEVQASGGGEGIADVSLPKFDGLQLRDPDTPSGPSSIMRW